MNTKYTQAQIDEGLKKLGLAENDITISNPINDVAISVAKKILIAPYGTSSTGETTKHEDCSIWESYLSGYKHSDEDMQGMLAAIRKAISDKFPIEEWYFHEIPFYNEKYVLIYFVNKKDYDDYHWHKKKVGIRSIAFECEYNKFFGQPMKEVDTDEIGIQLCKVNTCQEAVVTYFD